MGLRGPGSRARWRSACFRRLPVEIKANSTIPSEMGLIVSLTKPPESGTTSRVTFVKELSQ